MSGGETGGVQAFAFVVRGRVQGVWYRDTAQRAARELGLTGWVRNRRSGELAGAVDGEAWGPPGALEEFRRRLEKGSPASRVESVEWTPLGEIAVGDEGGTGGGAAKVPTDFEVRPTL